MSSQQCPCAELFKIGDDYTLLHHPDCGIAKAEKFGQLTEQGIDAAKQACQRYVEIYSQAKPIASFSATVVCRMCEHQYQVKQEVPNASKCIHWACPLCDHKTWMWFNEQVAIDSLESRMPAPLGMALTCMEAINALMDSMDYQGPRLSSSDDLATIQKLLESKGPDACIYEDPHGNIILESGESND